MPNVGGKKFPYTPAGMQMAKEKSAQTGQPVIKNYSGGGPVTITIPSNEERYTVTQGHKNHPKKNFKFA